MALGVRTMRQCFLAIIVCHGTALVAEEAVSGPETEARFPALSVPDGFKATLFACDPLVEYPSVVSIGPDSGTLFAAHDYVTGLGVDIVRRDEVRLLRDTNADGYADESVVYASGFNSIQGLLYDEGNVYVMHAPFLTKLTDSDGDSIADQRIDLLEGIGQPPEITPDRLHCANGIVRGHDGWLYLAAGDRSCDIQRPEGDRFVFREGGILRCRPDGHDLHVFSHGLRNIYDIALDEELNVLVRDNENDGGDYLIRVCHCFHGSDHGYPYLYRDAPLEAMPPLVEFGKGSSAGITAYRETAFPADYRSKLYFCEWGRAVVTYDRRRLAGSFAASREADFAAGATDDPYGFHPTDVVVDHDGSLLISDWGDGQRPKRGRGRIYRIEYSNGDQSRETLKEQLAELMESGRSATSIERLVGLLNSESYYVRTLSDALSEFRILEWRLCGTPSKRVSCRQRHYSMPYGFLRGWRGRPLPTTCLELLNLMTIHAFARRLCGQSPICLIRYLSVIAWMPDSAIMLCASASHEYRSTIPACDSKC